MTARAEPIAAPTTAARGGGVRFDRLALHVALIVLMLIWALPAIGLLITSFRPADAASSPVGGPPCSRPTSSRSRTTPTS